MDLANAFEEHADTLAAIESTGESTEFYSNAANSRISTRRQRQSFHDGSLRRCTKRC